MRTISNLLRAMALLLAVFLCTACVMPKGNVPKNADSSKIILPTDRGNDEVERVSNRTPGSDISAFGSFLENSILFRMQATANTNRGASSGNEVQIVVLEPEGDLADGIMIPEYSDMIPPQPAWHEWIKPRLFLAKWSDYWLHETNATPVVLVSFSF